MLCPDVAFETGSLPNLRRIEARDSGHRISKMLNAGQVPMDHAHGRIGFMSTRRRENRRRNSTICEEAFASGTQIDRATARGATALLMSIVWLAWAWFHSSDKDQSPEGWMATNPLRSDHRNGVIAGLISHCSSPPKSGINRSATVVTASHRSIVPHIPIPSARTRTRRTLPQATAGQSRWAERYDGKGNLHFEHAA